MDTPREIRPILSLLMVGILLGSITAPVRGEGFTSLPDNMPLSLGAGGLTGAWIHEGIRQVTSKGLMAVPGAGALGLVGALGIQVIAQVLASPDRREPELDFGRVLTQSLFSMGGAALLGGIVAAAFPGVAAAAFIASVAGGVLGQLLGDWLVPGGGPPASRPEHTGQVLGVTLPGEAGREG